VLPQKVERIGLEQNEAADACKKELRRLQRDRAAERVADELDRRVEPFAERENKLRLRVQRLRRRNRPRRRLAVVSPDVVEIRAE